MIKKYGPPCLAITLSALQPMAIYLGTNEIIVNAHIAMCLFNMSFFLLIAAKLMETISMVEQDEQDIVRPASVRDVQELDLEIEKLIERKEEIIEILLQKTASN